MSDPLFLWHFSRHVCHGSAVGACWLCGEGNRKGFRGDMAQTSAWSRRASWGCLCLMTSPLQSRSTRWSQGGVRWPSPASHQVPRLLPCPELCGSLEGQCGGAGALHSTEMPWGGRGKVDNAPWTSPWSGPGKGCRSCGLCWRAPWCREAGFRSMLVRPH